MTPRIVIVTGAPGAGKSTVARLLAEQSERECAVHLHTDDFYVYVRKGYLDPWLPEAHPQNIVVTGALTASAAAYARGGYDVLVDGVVGPWLFDPWLAIARNENLDLHYIVLRPSEAETVTRATSRTGRKALKDEAVVRLMWGHFSALGPYEANVLDTSGQESAETAAVLLEALREGKYKI
jgi:chloramphenicol 3-O-phosphotransferase